MSLPNLDLDDGTRALDRPPSARPAQRAPDPNARIGKTLGRYVLLRRLGQGGMGVVYAARDPVLEREVAVKVLGEAFGNEPDAGRRFLKEAKTAARLNHPNIVTVYDSDEADGAVFLVMEMIDGGTAQDAINRVGRLDWREATRIVADVCRGLAAAHSAGLIHRDIKPSNVMLSRDGAVKLADFGLALVANGANRSISGGVSAVGTPYYMSPEQCRGARIGPRADLYALGATYFALLTGRPPFPKANILEVMHAHCSDPPPDLAEGAPDAPAACAAVIYRALAKEPADRFHTAAEMLSALEAVRAERSRTAVVIAKAPTHPTNSPLEETSVLPAIKGPKLSRRTWLMTAGGGASLLMGGSVATLFLTRRSAGPSTAPGPANSDKAQVITHSREIVVNGQVESMAFSPREKGLLAYGLEAGVARLIMTTRTEERYSEALPTAVRHVFFSPAYDYWGVECDGALFFWDTLSKRPRSDLNTKQSDHPGGTVSCVAFNPNGTEVALGVQATTGDDGWIVLRDCQAKGASYRRVEQRGPSVNAATWSHDGKWLVTGHSDGSVRLRNGCDPGPPVKVLPTSAKPVRSIVCLPGTERLVAAAGCNVDCFENGERRTLDTLRIPVSSLALSPDGRLLACTDGINVGLYDLAANQRLATLQGHEAAVRIVTFDHDGGTLASASGNGQIRLWDIPDSWRKKPGAASVG